MISPNNLLILKKYRDSHYVCYTDKIFKGFIINLCYEFGKNIDNKNYKRLFVSIFINNIVRYLYD